MSIDLDNLERLAREATPGPWEDSWDGPDLYVASDTTIITGLVDSQADAAYIAVVSPDVVLALIERVRAAESWTGCPSCGAWREAMDDGIV